MYLVVDVFLESEKTVYVKMLSGRTLLLQVQPSSFVSDLLAKIHETTTLPTKQFRLIFDEIPLHPEKSLSNYDIPNESILYLLPRKSVVLACIANLLHCMLL